MSEIITNKLTGKTAANDVTVTVGATATQSLHSGITKSWCCWSMNNTGTPYDSLNISSITDEASTVNQLFYTSSVASANAQCISTCTNANAAGVDNYSTSDAIAFRPRTDNIKFVNASNTNPAFVHLKMTGDLA